MTSEQPKLGVASMKKLFRKKRGSSLKRVKKVMKRKAENLKPIRRRMPLEGASGTSTRSSDDVMACEQSRVNNHVIMEQNGKQLSDGNSSSGRTEHLNEVNSPLAPCLVNNVSLQNPSSPPFTENPELMANIDRTGGPEGPPNITWRLTDALDKVRHYFDPAGPGYPPIQQQNGFHFHQDQNDFLREQASLGGRNEQLSTETRPEQALPQPTAPIPPPVAQQAPVSYANLNTDFSNVASLSTNHHAPPPPPYHQINQSGGSVPHQQLPPPMMHHQQQQQYSSNHGYPQHQHHPGNHVYPGYHPHHHNYPYGHAAPPYPSNHMKHPGYPAMPPNSQGYSHPPSHIYNGFPQPQQQPPMNHEKRNCLNVNVYLP